jgi:lipopolysaccharide biosynthesis glycosyltransferase
MLIPALFVADSVNKAAGSARRFETHVFAAASEVSAVHRQLASGRGITLSDDLDTSKIEDVPILQERLTSATLMKLLLAGHLAGRYDKILYLDTDLTIHGDVSSLFALETGDFPVAAVRTGRLWVDEERRRKAEAHFGALGMTAPYHYFNTGVVLIDVAKWIREDLGNRALDFIRQHVELCVLPDEDALNAILDGRFAELSPIWNIGTGSGLPIVQKIAPVIVHHSGPDKPWRRYGYRKRLFPDRTAYRLYEAFLADTPWPGWLDEQWTGRDLYGSIVWEIRLIARRLRSKLTEPSRQQRRTYAEACRSYLDRTEFADISQGIAVRQDGRVRLNDKQGTVA